MKQIRFTESQIISILAKQEKGITVADICREDGILIPGDKGSLLFCLR